jgi:serine/threonine protein kinase
MPKDSSIVGTPPNHSSSHFSRIHQAEEKKYDQLEMMRLIGRGTFSQVFLSREMSSGDTFAVKVMDLRRFEEEYNSEVSVMLNLSQQGVNVNFIASEVDEVNDTGYIYMNYLPFPTLSEFLEKAPYGVDERQALLIFHNLVNVLEDIHACSVAHKDLKPENIFVDPSSFNVSVIDFGLSAIVDGTHEKKFCGSPLYMAPEMLNKEPYDPILADIWSVGVIFYEMLLGSNPWANAECLEDLIDLVARIEYPSYISEQSKAVLSSILVLDPPKRDSLMMIKSKLSSLLDDDVEM